MKEISKDTVIRIRVTSAHKQELEEARKKMGFGSLSAYTLKALSSFTKKPTPAQKRISSNIQNETYHLARIGNNLNQVAYAVNKAFTTGKVTEKTAKEVAEELMYINIQLSNLLK